jgi:hypothetical protein
VQICATVSAQRLQFDLFSSATMCRPVPVPFSPAPTSTCLRSTQAASRRTGRFYSRGIAFDFYRDIARVTGRMVVDYAEGLDVSKIVFT